VSTKYTQTTLDSLGFTYIAGGKNPGITTTLHKEMVHKNAKHPRTGHCCHTQLSEIELKANTIKEKRREHVGFYIYLAQVKEISDGSIVKCAY